MEIAHLRSLALLLHDVILTSGQEYRYIWQLSKSWFSRILYVWNRYMYLLATILGLGAISPISNLILNLVGPAMFTTLRIYALSKKNRLLGGVALVLSMVPFFINTSAAYQSVPINLPAPLNCQSYSTASTSLDIGISSILNSRFLLALHETNARLEGAAGDTDTAVSVSSLCFNPRSGGTAGTPTRSQLPDFLGIIGGPVHSFHHADDLESLDIVPLPQRQSAPQSGLGGEVPESGGDPGGNAAV
ncbi:hypothetical protein TRAPUB_14141 [Trametes pubescens]|uniref:DUF6533 domain-containing protein n=1 Tax=Trametes pubescens TaxID=154538 RepID=A0A1M2W7W5_TRAPU|nr:hypothetical protein TRAPUB_14141 [Trametes pubescens]